MKVLKDERHRLKLMYLEEKLNAEIVSDELAPLNDSPVGIP